MPTRPNAWFNIFCEEPGCCAVIRRLRYREYRFRMCRRHMASTVAKDPERIAKMKLGQRRFFDANPGHLVERHRKTGAALRARLASDPELAARYHQLGKRMSESFAGYVPPDPGARSRRSAATKLADIPVAYREEYVALGKRRIPAAERKRLILEQAEKDARKHHRAHSGSTDAQLLSAFGQGCAAGRKPDGYLSDNPHEHGTDRWQAWREGFNLERQEAA